MVARSRNVVSMIYLFGRERNTTPELLVYFTTRVMERVNGSSQPSALSLPAAL
jgi:hypothetical protein